MCIERVVGKAEFMSYLCQWEKIDSLMSLKFPVDDFANTCTASKYHFTNA